MPEFWKPLIDPVQAGEPVDSAVTNRPTAQLSAREEYLYEQIQSLNQKSGRLLTSSVELGVGVAAGSFVYLDGSTGRYELARASYSYADGVPAVAASTRACGLVLVSDGAGTGDVLLRGVIDPAGFNLSGQTMLDRATDQFVDGPYYLSRLDAGRMSPRPSAPIVPLGFFGPAGFVFDPVALGDLHPHLHEAFDLAARPAASQNNLRTGFSASGHFVDSCYLDAGRTAIPVAVGLRVAGSLMVTQSTRVDLGVDPDGLLSMSVYAGGSLDYLTPGDRTSPSTDLGTRNWPQYGEYIPLGSTGVELFFFRPDGRYADTTLSADVAAHLSAKTDYFRVFLPDDLTGWTNANPFDPATPPGARLRYLLEADPALLLQFPPAPVEAASLSCNGVALCAGTDFALSAEGLWWCAPPAALADPARFGNFVGDPWPTDWSTPASEAGTLAYANSRRLRLCFARSDYRTGDALVTSLRSNSAALSVTRCPGGGEGTTGDLALDLDLALAAASTLVAGAETAFTSVDGVELSSTSVVTELVAGDGISIERASVTNASGSALRGRLRISRKDVALEGEITSIALRGAAETIYHQDLLPYLCFKRLDGRPGPTGAVATFKLPSGCPSPLSLQVKANVLGDVTMPATTQGGRAVFRVLYHAVRPGMTLGSLSDATALAVQYWACYFPVGYVPFAVSPAVLPTIYAGTATDFSLSPATINPASPFAGAGLRGDDLVAVYFSRVATVSGNAVLVDNYPGQVGFLNLRWSVASV